MKTPRADVEARIRSIFARCPSLHGFAVQERDLLVTDIGVYPRIESQYDEIHDTIAGAISDLVHDQPHVRDYLRGRTFARSLH